MTNLYIIIVTIFILYHFRIYVNNRIRCELYNTYEKIYEIVTQCKNLAYAKIFNEYIFVELTSRTKLSTEQLNKLSKEYNKILYELLGENLLNTLIDIYGSETSLIYNFSSEFINQIILDEKKYNDTNVSGYQEND